MRNSNRLMVASGLVLALVMGLAVFAIANNGGVIYACVNNDSGTVKIVAEGTVCSQNWTLTTWNQQGVDGLDGADGADGTDGTDGVDGMDGVDGVDGAGGVSGLERVVAEKVVTAVKAGDLVRLEAICPAGKKTTGGGATASPRFVVTASLSNFELTEWVVAWVATEDVDSSVVFTVAICADVAP